MESVFKIRNEDQKLVVQKEKIFVYVSGLFPFYLYYLKESESFKNNIWSMT